MEYTKLEFTTLRFLVKIIESSKGSAAIDLGIIYYFYFVTP